MLNYVDMDLEVSMLEYGISLIVLNGGMYLVASAIMTMKLSKRWKLHPSLLDNFT